MAVRVSSTDILTATVSSTAGIVDPVASGITGWSPGHSDTSGTILDCCHITGNYWNYAQQRIVNYANSDLPYFYLLVVKQALRILQCQHCLLLPLEQNS